jgi:hypothetical protein
VRVVVQMPAGWTEALGEAAFRALAADAQRRALLAAQARPIQAPI